MPKTISKKPPAAAEPPQLNLAAWLILASGLLVHAILGEWSIRAQSATFDEPVHLTAGRLYWQTRDYRYNEDHPPLSSMIAAAPFLFNAPAFPKEHPFILRPEWRNTRKQYAIAHAFLYEPPNETKGEELIKRGRRAILAVTLLFLVGYFFLSRAMLGPAAAWLPFGLAALCPAILAHGALATTDALFADFFFLFFAGLHWWESRTGDQPNASQTKTAFLTGAAGGLALASKFSALIMGPLWLWWLFRQKKEILLRWRDHAALLAGGAAAILVVYQFVGIPDFFSSIEWNLERLKGVRASFAAGRHSVGGWWFYFPLAFLVKTPLAAVIGLAALAIAWFRRRLSLPWFLIVPPLVYFLMACRSPIQIGHRHILPVYLFLYLALGWFVKSFWDKKSARLAVGAGLVWFGVSLAGAMPFPLAHFNEIPALIGKKPYDLFVDSNLDWGQGLAALKKYLEREKVGAIYFSYFGTADPHAYGIRYKSLASYTIHPLADDPVDLAQETQQLFVISATNYQTVYFADHNIFDWLHSRQPDAVLAESLLVFDITHDAESKRRLSLFFTRLSGGTR